MDLIGLSGYARSGKDAAAEVLVKEFGYTRVAFADKLREFLYALNPIVLSEWDEKAGMANARVQQVIDYFGWNGYKNSQYGDEIRSLLQRLGTEAGRETLWDSIWIDAAFHDLDESGKYVITDVRFPNEADAIKQRGGSLWRITRDGVGPATAPDGTVHKSETSLDTYPFDKELQNSTDLAGYQKTVRFVATQTKADVKRRGKK